MGIDLYHLDKPWPDHRSNEKLDLYQPSLKFIEYLPNNPLGDGVQVSNPNLGNHQKDRANTFQQGEGMYCQPVSFALQALPTTNMCHYGF